MGKQPEQTERFTADKFCGQCGQKNFRPNRSLKELFKEFVEDWLGYDNKLFKTAVKLSKPAALSLDYFKNSHHKNHYITPIRLYLLLSVIFYLMTNFGGLNLTEIDVKDISVQASPEQVAKAESKIEEALEEASSEQEKAILEESLERVKQANDPTQNNDQLKLSITGDNDFNSSQGCLKPPEDYINIWPQWLDSKLDQGVEQLCNSYQSILNLPEDQQKVAKAEWGLSLGQRAIEVIPQSFFLSLPILALVVGIFYFLSHRLYVEHLVLLMHSHSFIFAITLLYLGWFKLTGVFPSLEMIPMGAIFALWGLIYLYLSQKWFYKRGWWATLWRFFLFGLIYMTLMSFIVGFSSFIAFILG